MLVFRPFLIAFTFFLLFPQAGKAQHIFNNFSFQQGLSSYNILKVLQDTHGFIWIATQDGLFRYNGKNFDVLKKGNSIHSISENYILDMCLGAGDSIIVSTFPSGINIISTNTLISRALFADRRNLELSSDKGATWMHKIHFTVNGEIWMGNDKTLVIYDQHSGKKSTIMNIPGVTGPLDISFIAPVNEQTLAIGIKKFGIALIDIQSKKTGATIPSRDITETETEEDIVDLISSNDHIYVCFEHSIIEGAFKNNKWVTARRFGIPFPDQTILTTMALYARDQVLWYGSSTGIGNINLVTGRSEIIRATSLIHSYTPNPISHLFADNQGNLWVSGSKSLQVTPLTPSPFKAYTGYPGTPLEHIYSIDTVNHSTILTTGKNGLYLTDLKTGISGLVEGSDGHGTVHYAYRLNNDQYLISTDDGQFLWSVSSGLFSKEALARQFPEWKRFINNYFNNAITRGSDVYFASEEEEGLVKWERKSQRIVQFKQGDSRSGSLPENHIHNIKTDNDGNIWLLFDSHIAKFDPDLGKVSMLFSYTNGKAGPSAGIFFDAFDSKSKIWFGTYGGGLNSWDKKTREWDYISEENGLCNNSIYGILPENDSIIWVSTNMGISRVNHYLKSCQNFYAADGLQDNSFDEKGYFRNGEKLYFGGINGFTEINTSLVKNNRPPEKKYVYKIEYYEGHEKKTVYGLDWGKILLPSKTKLVTLHICSPQYPSSAQQKFYYKISQDRDGDFIPVNDLNKIDINITNHGSYHIDITTKNEYGKFSDQLLTFQFYILPKWYQTWWFKSLIALSLLAIAYGLYRLRINQLRKEEKIRNQLASDLHDDLGSTLNSIKVHSNLAQMEKDNPNHLVMVKQGAQDAINGVRDIIWVLDDKKDQLGDTLTRVGQFAEPLCQAQRVQYKAVLGDETQSYKLGKEEKRNLYMIIKESINNSLKYANSSQITLMTSRSDKKLRIEISDNGQGFDLASSGMGYGLRNIRNRAKTVGYTAEIISSPGAGTRIILEKI